MVTICNSQQSTKLYSLVTDFTKDFSDGDNLIKIRLACKRNSLSQFNSDAAISKNSSVISCTNFVLSVITIWYLAKFR